MVTFYDKNGVEIKSGMHIRCVLDGRVDTVQESSGSLCIVDDEEIGLPPLRISLVSFAPDTSLTGDNKLVYFEIIP